MLKLNSVLIFSENPKKLSEFYKKVFQGKVMWEEGNYTGLEAGNGMVIIGPHDKVHGKSKNPERIIINFETKSVEEEFKRIKEIGAKVIAKPYHPMEEDKMTLATFEDPDGNYFQLASPMENK